MVGGGAESDSAIVEFGSRSRRSESRWENGRPGSKKDVVATGFRGARARCRSGRSVVAPDASSVNSATSVSAGLGLDVVAQGGELGIDGERLMPSSVERRCRYRCGAAGFLPSSAARLACRAGLWWWSLPYGEFFREGSVMVGHRCASHHHGSGGVVGV